MRRWYIGLLKPSKGGVVGKTDVGKVVASAKLTSISGAIGY